MHVLCDCPTDAFTPLGCLYCLHLQISPMENVCPNAASFGRRIPTYHLSRPFPQLDLHHHRHCSDTVLAPLDPTFQRMGRAWPKPSAVERQMQCMYPYFVSLQSAFCFGYVVGSCTWQSEEVQPGTVLVRASFAKSAFAFMAILLPPIFS